MHKFPEENGIWIVPATISFVSRQFKKQQQQKKKTFCFLPEYFSVSVWLSAYLFNIRAKSFLFFIFIKKNV